MSSEGASLVAHRVLLPRDPPALRDAENKDVMERIPVEIWREILLICIACPLLLQRYGDQYHDIPWIVEIDCDLVAKYKQSERIRTRLRLVCQSWNQSLDEHSNRLVQLMPRVQSGYWPPVKQWDRVVRISGTSSYCFCEESCWPPSLHDDDWASNIDSPSHLSPSERSTIRGHLTCLSERCMAVSLPGFWRDELVEQPGLRSVTMLKEDFDGQDNVGIRMSALSNTYRKLTYLEILVTTINDPSVGLELPFLTTLRLTTRGNLIPSAVNSAIAGAIGTWTLPNIEFINFDMLSASKGEIDAFNLLIRQVGRTVSTLIIANRQRWGSVSSTFIFSADIWPSLPTLTCLGMGYTDLLYVRGPPHNLGGPFIDLRFATGGIWFPSSLVKDLTRVFPTKWSASTLGAVTLDLTWERAVQIKGEEVLTPSHLALFEVFHHTGKGLADSAGIPFDSTIRASLI